MGKETKVVAHEDTGPGTGIFYKRGYKDGYYSTLPIGYSLPSLDSIDTTIISLQDNVATVW